MTVQLSKLKELYSDDMRLYAHTFELRDGRMEYSLSEIRFTETVNSLETLTPYLGIFTYNQGVSAPHIRITDLA